MKIDDKIYEVNGQLKRLSNKYGRLVCFARAICQHPNLKRRTMDTSKMFDGKVPVTPKSITIETCNDCGLERVADTEV